HRDRGGGDDRGHTGRLRYRLLLAGRPSQQRGALRAPAGASGLAVRQRPAWRGGVREGGGTGVGRAGAACQNKLCCLASASTGSRSERSSFATLLTREETGKAVQPSGSAGFSSACKASGAVSGESQAPKPSGGRITGMRSWIGRSRALASVVRMVQLSTAGASFGSAGSCQRSQRPAKAKGPPSRRQIRKGCLAPSTRVCHS